MGRRFGWVWRFGLIRLESALVWRFGWVWLDLVCLEILLDFEIWLGWRSGHRVGWKFGWVRDFVGARFGWVGELVRLENLWVELGWIFGCAGLLIWFGWRLRLVGDLSLLETGLETGLKTWLE